MRIGQRLILGFVGIALLIGLVGYVSVDASQKAVQKSIGEGYSSLTTEAMGNMDRIIYTRIERWKSYSATNPRLHKALLDSNQEFEKLDNIEGYIGRKDREWMSQAKDTITPFMRGLINNELSERLRTRIRFYEREYGYKVIGEIFITNKYGANVTQTGKTSDYYQADEQWWQKARQDNLYVEDIEYDESADIYSIAICIKIDNESGDFLGIMKVVLNIEDIIGMIKELEKFEEHKAAQYTLLTGDGKIIYSTKKFKFFENISERLLQRFFMGEDEVKNGKALKHINYFIAKHRENGKTEKIFAHGHSRGYRGYKGLGWILVTEHETEEVFTPVIKLRNALLVISIGMTVLAILLGIFIARSISKPIARLKDTAVKIGQGRLDARIDIKSKDEIGELANTFNQMAEDLKETLVSREDLKKAYAQLKEVQNKLIVAEKLATIGKLAGIVSHEIRNPLAVIKNSSYFLNLKLGKKADKTIKRHLKILQEEVDKSNRIISDIIDFARLKPPEMKRVDINKMVRKILSRHHIPKGVSVETSFEKKLDKVYADPPQLERVFPNIILNALQSMPKGGKLEVNTARAGEYAAISFKDTGNGISAKNMERIFEPLFSTKATGVGLGLATCKNIIETHGGRIEVESEEGKGTTFTIKLPIKNEKGGRKS